MCLLVVCACMTENKCLHTQANTSARVHFADNGPTVEPETDPNVSQRSMSQPT